MEVITIHSNFEEEVEEACTCAYKYSITQSLSKLLSKLDYDGALKILEVFPFMIAVIDKPSVEMKEISDFDCLHLANNLTSSEILNILEMNPYKIDDLIENNRKIAEQTITEELAIACFQENGTHEYLSSYDHCDWYKNALKMYKLGEL